MQANQYDMEKCDIAWCPAALAMAIALDASFVARAFIGDQQQTKEVLTQAITHKGYALVDIFQPCATFNKINTYQWFKDNTYTLDQDHDPTDRNAAFARACESCDTGKLPLGVFYKPPEKLPYHEAIGMYATDHALLWQRSHDREKLINSF